MGWNKHKQPITLSPKISKFSVENDQICKDRTDFKKPYN